MKWACGAGKGMVTDFYPLTVAFVLSCWSPDTQCDFQKGDIMLRSRGQTRVLKCLLKDRARFYAW